MNEELQIRRDRMRFVKNSLCANLAIIAIVFDVLYFINIYEADVTHTVGNFYYQYRIGVSIIYNILFLLATFLSSEGIKNYKREYAFALIVLGVLQIVRIFWLPAQAAAAEVTVGSVTTRVMDAAQHVRVIIYLAASGACCIASGVIGLQRCRELSEHMASLEAKKG